MKSILTILAVLGTLAGVGAQEPKVFSKPTIDFGMIVRDVEKSAAFYTNALGCKEVGGFAVTAELGRKIGLTDGTPTQVRMFVLGDREGSAHIKLMSFKDLPKKADQTHIHSTLGIRYLTLYVTSIDQSLERLKKAGVKTLGETPVALGGNTRLLAVQDPDGNFIELIGP